MRLRSQLILAFLLLAIVPLAGVVGFTYWTNAAALRAALEKEASQLTERLEKSMQAASADLRRGLVGLDRRLGSAEMSLETDSIQGAIAEAMESMGPVADAIEGWRFGRIPQAPPTPSAPFPPEAALVENGGEPRPPLPPGSVVARASSAKRPAPGGGRPRLRDESLERVGLELARRRVEARARLEGLFFSVEKEREGAAKQAAEGSERGAWRVRFGRDGVVDSNDPVRSETAIREAVQVEIEGLARQLEEKGHAIGPAAESGDLGAVARMGVAAADLALKRIRIERLLGAEFPRVVDGMDLVPEVDVGQFVTGVLRTTQRKEGEIPFATYTEGNIYTVSTEDYDQLVALVDDEEALQTTSAETVLQRRGGWLIAQRLDSSSGLTFGIAKPYAASFKEIRVRTGRNLLLGFGMIGLSLVGILPLSSRLTRRITSLSSEAERLAGGDLAARVPVRSRDELGQLARTFNRMASRLQTNQEQLLGQERENQRQEVARTLLESENRRRGEELEEARKFQLAMLPEELPAVDEFEVAVYHRTATEVGGDYYDFAVRDDAMTIALGDATGHGARAATLVTVIRTLFLNGGASTSLASFLNQASVPLRSMSLERMAMSLLLVRLRRTEHRLTLASAGMPPAYRLRATGEVEELVCHALPLGTLADVEYREIEHDFEPGDTLVLLSDGLPEQTDSSGDPIGYERLIELIGESSGEGPAAIVERLRKCLEAGTGGGAPADDVTLVAVQMRA